MVGNVGCAVGPRFSGRIAGTRGIDGSRGTGGRLRLGEAGRRKFRQSRAI